LNGFGFGFGFDFGVFISGGFVIIIITIIDIGFDEILHPINLLFLYIIFVLIWAYRFFVC
jgi:hypothetical protein